MENTQIQGQAEYTREEIEKDIKMAKEAIKLAEALETLDRSTAFKKVFVKEFFEKVPKQMAQMYSVPDDRQKTIASNMITSVGALQTWLEGIRRKGHAARVELPQLETMAAQHGVNVTTLSE